MITVLLLVYYMHGGFIQTQSVTAPTYKDCLASLPLIEQQEQKRSNRLGLINKVKGYCINISKDD